MFLFLCCFAQQSFFLWLFCMGGELQCFIKTVASSLHFGIVLHLYLHMYIHLNIFFQRCIIFLLLGLARTNLYMCILERLVDGAYIIFKMRTIYVCMIYHIYIDIQWRERLCYSAHGITTSKLTH